MSRTPSSTGLALLTLPAAVLVAVGAVFVVRPALVLERVPELETALAAVDPEIVVLALAVVLVAFAPTLGIAGRLRPSSPSSLVADDSATEPRAPVDDRSATDRPDAVGAAIDERIALATAYDSEPRDVREAAREELLASLRSIAATAYANRAGIATEEAAAAIEAGAWTDDPRAAAFLAAPSGPSVPLWLWLVDLVRSADPFGRHLEATIDEIERLQSTATVVGPDVESETGSDESVAAGESDFGSKTAAGSEVSP